MSRLLIVDDNASVLAALVLAMRADRHQVQSASTGEDALQMFMPGNFDIVVTDLELPGIHGDQLAEELKTQDANVRFLLITATPLPTVPPCFEGVLIKPFTLEEFRLALRRLV